MKKKKLVTFRPALELLENRLCLSILYDYRVIAQTGDQDLIGMGDQPSINDKGEVAFVGQFSDGDGIFVGGTYALTNINPGFSHDFRRTFSRAVQINNNEQVEGVDRVVSSGHTDWLLRIWDAGSPDAFSVVVQGGAPTRFPGETFDAIDTNAGLNNEGDVAFAALDGDNWKLDLYSSLLGSAYEAVSLPDGESLRPQAAEPQTLVVKAGGQDNSPILLLKHVINNTFATIPIAGSDDFAQLGESPGITNDGKIVTFYGDLTPAGAANLSADQGDLPWLEQLHPGQGIFASIDMGGRRVIERIAGIAHNGFLDPGETFQDTNGDGQFDNNKVDEGPFTDFDPDSRMDVSPTRTDLDAVTIAYVAFDSGGNEGIYTSRLVLLPDHDSVSNPSLVAKVGDQLPGLSGKIQSLGFDNPVNKSGQVAFWAQTDSDTTAIVRADPLRTPVLIVPGIGGTSADDVRDSTQWRNWLLTRGIPPDNLRIDPLSHVYDGLIQTFQNAGYQLDSDQNPGDLFVANYDWRVPPGPSNQDFDGKIKGLSAQSILEDVAAGHFKYGVDYLGYWLKRAADEWKIIHPNSKPLENVDVIAHSTGGLVTRAYIQSDAYGDSFGPTTLPKIDNFILLTVPNQGASKAWNALHDNWIIDPAYILVLSKIVNEAYQKVLNGAIVNGPSQDDPDDNDIQRADILDATGQPSPELFIAKYVPTIRYLLPTYDFIDYGSGLQNINADPTLRNTLLLDLNAGLGLGITADHHSFATAVKATAIYGTTESTPTTAIFRILKPGLTWRFQDWHNSLTGAPFPPWYEDVIQDEGGDGTVPLLSQELNDQRIDELPVTGANVSHTGIVSGNVDVQKMILDIFGQPVRYDQIRTSGINWQAIKNAGFVIWHVVMDPVDGFVVDAEGRRLGFSKDTGVVTEIPNSVYFGGEDGMGWILGSPDSSPVMFELTGIGDNFYAEVSGFQDGAYADQVASGFLAEGTTASFGVGLNSVPMAKDDMYTVGQDNVLTVSAAQGVLANDSDPDGDVLTARLITQPVNGMVTVNADGSFTYTPNPGYNGTDSFYYVANDGVLDSNVATVEITVTPSGALPPGGGAGRTGGPFLHRYSPDSSNVLLTAEGITGARLSSKDSSANLLPLLIVDYGKRLDHPSIDDDNLVAIFHDKLHGSKGERLATLLAERFFELFRDDRHVLLDLRFDGQGREGLA